MWRCVVGAQGARRQGDSFAHVEPFPTLHQRCAMRFVHAERPSALPEVCAWWDGQLQRCRPVIGLRAGSAGWSGQSLWHRTPGRASMLPASATAARLA